jgi:peptide/nickel transport system substrate-binding protein
MVNQIHVRAWARALAAACVVGSLGLTAASSAGASPPAFTYQSAHAGGTLKLLASTAGGTLDPQVNYTL